MQDRFKYRVWNKTRKCFIESPEPTPLLQADGLLAYFSNNPDAMENYVIQFCTGLRDKNGTLIYEGDILADAKHKYVVEWSLSDGYFIRKPWICELFCYRIDKETTRNTKIIGNIYENAALLRKYGAFMSGA